MKHTIRPPRRTKQAVTTRHDPPVVGALRAFAARTGKDQWEVVEDGLNLIPGFRDVLAQEQEAYATKHEEDKRKHDSFVKQVREDIGS